MSSVATFHTLPLETVPDPFSSKQFICFTFSRNHTPLKKRPPLTSVILTYSDIDSWPNPFRQIQSIQTAGFANIFSVNYIKVGVSELKREVVNGRYPSRSSPLNLIYLPNTNTDHKMHISSWQVRLKSISV